MSRRNKIYLILIVITLFGIVYAELSKPKQLNWFPSYSSYHKIPFGSFVFNELMASRFDSIITVKRPPFEYLKSHEISGTYLFFNNQLSFGENELEMLLDWTEKGNTLIMASTDFEYGLLDTLDIDTDIVSIPENFSNQYQLALTHPELQPATQAVFDKAKTLYHFSEMDSSEVKVVGIVDSYKEGKTSFRDTLVNIIKKPHGKGNIILSTFPQAFTNYFILEAQNKNYTAGLMSYIDPKQPLFLDSYYKSGKTFYTSPLYLFLNNPYLKWAYYILLLAAAIYILFEGKRKQRPIPVIKPLKNQTLHYTRTIADMYYEKGSHGDIANHKIQHFLNYIRVQLHLPTADIQQEFLKQLSARSNNSIEEVSELFELITRIQQKNLVTKEDLQELNTRIEKFKSNNQWKTKT
jgi:hypothetical protein